MGALGNWFRAASTLSLGVVVAENNVNLGDAFCSEIEGFNLRFVHADECFHPAGIGLLLRECCQFIPQVSDLLLREPTFSYHEACPIGNNTPLVVAFNTLPQY